MRSSRLVVGGVVVLRSTPPHRWRSNSTEPQFSLWYQEPVPAPVSVPVHGMSSVQEEASSPGPRRGRGALALCT